MSTNFHHAEDQKKKNAQFIGLFAGSIFGVGTIIGVWEVIWRFGLGPWGFSDKKGAFFAIHGTFSYLVHFVYPGYVGDLERTWGAFSEALIQNHLLESFLATIWIPFVTGTVVFLTVWIWIYRALSGTREAGYVRGSRIKTK